jgi:hypothetical protein
MIPVGGTDVATGNSPLVMRVLHGVVEASASWTATGSTSPPSCPSP